MVCPPEMASGNSQFLGGGFVVQGPCCCCQKSLVDSSSLLARREAVHSCLRQPADGTEVIGKQRGWVRRQRNPCSNHTIDKLLNLLLKNFFFTPVGFHFLEYMSRLAEALSFGWEHLQTGIILSRFLIWFYLPPSLPPRFIVNFPAV